MSLLLLQGGVDKYVYKNVFKIKPIVKEAPKHRQISYFIEIKKNNKTVNVIPTSNVVSNF